MVPNAGELCVFEDRLGELLVRGDECRLHRELGVLCAVVALVGLGDPLRGDGGGDVASRVPAHPIGDEEQVLPGEAGVLVVRTHAADVRDGRAIDERRHGAYRRSSNVVAPTFTVAPMATGVGTVTRVPSRKVPFVESRSCSIHCSFQSMSLAWCVEV